MSPPISSHFSATLDLPVKSSKTPATMKSTFSPSPSIPIPFQIEKRSSRSSILGMDVPEGAQMQPLHSCSPHPDIEFLEQRALPKLSLGYEEKKNEEEEAEKTGQHQQQQPHLQGLTAPSTSSVKYGSPSPSSLSFPSSKVLDRERRISLSSICEPCDCGIKDVLAPNHHPHHFLHHASHHGSSSNDRLRTASPATPCEGCDCELKDLAPLSPKKPCDACDECDDLCGSPSCLHCIEKKNTIEHRPKKKNSCLLQTFTQCQIKRHNREDDCWIICDGEVYDITDFIHSGEHPGGNKSMINKAGLDCTNDFHFHSKTAKKLLKQFTIGRVVPCARDRCAKKKPSSSFLSFFSW